jgi:hypothetical protein
MIPIPFIAVDIKLVHDFSYCEINEIRYLVFWLMVYHTMPNTADQM